jgi:hypothetical protein
MYISNERIIMASQNAKPKDSVARNTDAQSMHIYIYIHIEPEGITIERKKTKHLILLNNCQQSKEHRRERVFLSKKIFFVHK